MIVIYSKWITKIVSLGKAFAITLFPFIFITERKNGYVDDVVRIHEGIHIMQQLEILVASAPVIAILTIESWWWLLLIPGNPYYLLYGVEYLWRRYQYRDHKQAYYMISFEREAHANQMDPNYIAQRPFFESFKYLNTRV